MTLPSSNPSPDDQPTLGLKQERRRELKRARDRAYYARNAERIKSHVRGWQRENPKKLLEYNRKVYARSPEKHREDNKAARRRYRAEAFELLGGAFCAKCGFGDWRALQIDHINGGGSKHVKKIGGGNGLVHAARRNPELFQVLCANCNSIKRFEEDEPSRAKSKS